MGTTDIPRSGYLGPDQRQVTAARLLDAELGEPQRAEVRGGTLAFWRKGHGGVPLLLVHGWPSTRRIWVRNIADLAARGFDVVTPDLRGFGDSDCGADGLHDVVAHSLDMATLLQERLGLDQVVAAGGDLGAAVIQDLSLRFPGLVERLVVFNGPLPNVPGRMDHLPPTRRRLEDSHGFRPATEPDLLVAELATPEAKMAYVAEHYQTWSPDGAFVEGDLAYLTEPFVDPTKLRASFGTYESLLHTEARTGRSMIHANDTPTLIMEGLSDPRGLHHLRTEGEDRVPAACGPVRGAGRRSLPPMGRRRNSGRRHRHVLCRPARPTPMAGTTRAGGAGRATGRVKGRPEYERPDQGG